MIRGKRYIYHVYDQKTGQKIISGSSDECAERIGLSNNTIRRMANGHDERRDPSLRGCYEVTAELDDSPRSTLNTYIVRLARTGRIIADGNAEECADQLGMASVDQFYQMVWYVRSGRHRTKYDIEIIRE